MKIVRKILSFSLLSLTLLYSLTSCKNKNTRSKEKHTTSEDIQLNVHSANSESQEPFSLWHPEEGTIFVLFGYGFNNEEFRNDAEKKLEETFGLKENNGLVQVIIYPDDLRNRIMNMYDIISESHVKGIILLGAPENTHFMLAKLQDEWDSTPPYSVFSFFPQDDILGQEATCDFVLDHAPETEEDSINNKKEQTVDKDAENLLIRAVYYMASLPGPLPPDTDLHTHVQTITGERKVHRYTDSETGLQSINHFVMEN